MSNNESKPQDQAAPDNHAGQLADHNPRCHRDRGASPEDAERLAAARKRDVAGGEAEK